jgi:hypothetical protein
MACTVCIENYNMVSRKELKCPYCQYNACSSCVRQYLLQSSMDPHCMNCRRQWKRDILTELLPQSFINKDLKKHREDILYEREKSLMPDTQPKVQQTKMLRALQQENQRMQNLLNEKLQEIAKLRTDIQDNARNQRVYQSSQAVNLFQNKRAFVRGCPDAECRGFVNNEWQCGICNKYICSKCHEIIGLSKENTDHECKEEDKETAKMIMTQTRPCPKCAVPIFKIDGCDQMWCTQCHTAFSWRTGAIETIRIHNPHYYEWQRETGGAHPIAREPGDNPCGGFPDIYRIQSWFKVSQDILRAIRRHRINPTIYPMPTNASNIPPEYDEVFNIHRCINHIEMVELPRYRNTGYVETNEDLRVRYLMNELTEDELKLQLQQREKRHQKRQSIYMILEMFTHTSSDIFRNYIHGHYSSENAKKLIYEMTQLKNYVNQQQRKVSHQFNCRCPNVSDRWEIVSV